MGEKKILFCIILWYFQYSAFIPYAQINRRKNKTKHRDTDCAEPPSLAQLV